MVVRRGVGWTRWLDYVDKDLEAAPEHAFAIERQRLWIHVRHSRILHDFGIHVAVVARLVHDP